MSRNINTDDIQDVQEWLFHPGCITEFCLERKVRLSASLAFIKNHKETGNNWVKYVELGTRNRPINQNITLQKLLLPY